MTNKELKCLGMALDALMEAGMYDAARKIIKTMAEVPLDTTEKESDKEVRHGAGGHQAG
jgi:hypothetical protein